MRKIWIFVLVMVLLLGSTTAAFATVDCLETSCLWVEPSLHDDENPSGAVEVTVQPLEEVRLEVTLYKSPAEGGDLSVEVSVPIYTSTVIDFSYDDPAMPGEWVSRDGQLTFLGTLIGSEGTAALTLSMADEGVYVYTPEISATQPITYCEYCSQTLTVTVVNASSPSPVISSFAPGLVVAGERFWIYGDSFLGGSTDMGCSELFVFIHDPQMGGTYWLDACQEFVTWEDSTVSFLWPERLKEFSEYEVKILRVHTQSNTVNIETGGRMFLPFMFK